MNILLGVLEWIGGIAAGLGIGGTITVVFGLLILALVLKCAERALNLFARLGKSWRRLPVWGKQLVGLAVAVVAWKALWPLLPKTTTALALGCGVAVTWWLGGLRLARRYGLENTTATRAWAHHWETTATQRGLTKAVGNATGKPNGRARKPTNTPTGVETIVEPPDQMSAQAFADLVNDGGLHPSVARQVGWSEVKGTNATVMPDGLVKLHVDRVSEDGGEPLAETQWWTP